VVRATHPRSREVRRRQMMCRGRPGGCLKRAKRCATRQRRKKAEANGVAEGVGTGPPGVSSGEVGKKRAQPRKAGIRAMQTAQAAAQEGGGD